MPRLSVDERRAQLVATGLELFTDRPFDTIGVDDIADAAGVSRGLLYHYFQSKRDLYVEVVRGVGEDLLRLTATADELVTEDRLRGSLTAYLDYVEDHARAYCLILRGGLGSDPAVQEIVDSCRDRFVERLVAEQAAERAEDPATRLAVRGWIGFVEGACLHWLDRRDVERDALLELLAAPLEASLAAAGVPG